jgi:hypothetical protein
MARRDRRASPLVDSLAVGFRRGSRRFDAPGDRSILRYVSSLIKQSFGSIGGSVMGLASICLIEVIGHLCLVTRCGAGLLDGIIICRTLRQLQYSSRSTPESAGSLPRQKRCILSCGLRRSKLSSAYRICPAWRQRIASYRLRRSRA